MVRWASHAVTLIEFVSLSLHLLAMRPWTSELSFSNLNFHLYKMGIILELMAGLSGMWHIK